MHVLVIVELRLQDALGSKGPNGGQSGQRGSQMGVYGRPSYSKKVKDALKTLKYPKLFFKDS